jgi:3D (Asp-Asp-Asp) domain-containing protein
VCPAFAIERSALARVTVYWPGEGSGAHAAWNGVRLSEAACAVDPRKIPYGSKIIVRDAVCVAIDTGPDVVNRKASRLCGRNAAERKAIVIDRFFATKQKALAWAKEHPHFMMVRILTPESKQDSKYATTKHPGSPLPTVASSATIASEGRPNHVQLGLYPYRTVQTSPLANSFLQFARRRQSRLFTFRNPLLRSSPNFNRVS